MVETDYSLMLAEILADVHQQCLEAHDWSSMEHIINVPVDASQRELDLTRLEAAGGDISDTDTALKNDSTLLWDLGGLPSAYLFDDSSDTEGRQLYYIGEREMGRLYQQDRDQTNSEPSHFSLRQSPDRAGLEMLIYPAASETRHIRMGFWTPEGEIDTDADDSRTLLVPHRPLILGTIMLALNERGEELGEPGNIAERRFYDALSASIELDMNRRGRADVYEFRRD
jgi:hypothetical protein